MFKKQTIALFALFLTSLSQAASAGPPAPIVWDKRVQTTPGKAVTIRLDGLDEGGESMSFVIATQPKFGTLGPVVSAGPNSATVVYTPSGATSGLDSFTFRALDASSLKSHGATVVVLVGMNPEVGVLAPRKPKGKLKREANLYTPEQIAYARELCKTNRDASAMLAHLKQRSAYWISLSDEQLRKMLPDWRVPRAFNTSVGGCPKHGKEIYKHGTYPWKLDEKQPYKITCPVGGESYPSNDFGAYYASDFKDHKLLKGEYVDPGRGWLGPDGEKRWMVGYAVHWHWRQTWMPAVVRLAQAYALSGEKIYAQKAIAMLDRIAEIYPNMIHALQGRYSELEKGRYRGKIVNSIWETSLFTLFVQAYDYVFPALVGSDPVSLPWRSAAEIRSNIEANLLEEGIDAIGAGNIRGNFGMHQKALTYAAYVRQGPDTDKILQTMLSATGGSAADEGMDYALYNFVYKDGVAFENGLGYSFLWVDSFATLASPLALAGYNLYDNNRFKAMLTAPLDLLMADNYTPSAGDSGSIDAKEVMPAETTYRLAFRQLGTPETAYAWMKLSNGTVKDYRSFNDLFFPPLATKAQEAAKKYNANLKTRFLDGYGIGIINNRKNTLAASLLYGIWGSHYHFDRLGVELVSHSTRLSPDLGYPDFMNSYVPGIFTWSTNTIAHNTLLVDDKKQDANFPTPLYRAYHGKQFHVLDTLNGTGTTYAHCDRYRRTLVLRETNEDEGYFVDVFRVRGGKKSYNLSFHGNEATFTLHGAALSPPETQGTLAGKDVKLGQIYDDAVLGAPGYTGRYNGYQGSGFQHLFNWQKATPSDVAVAQWQLNDPPDTSLRLHILPAENQQVIVADAYVSPTQKVDTILKYVLLRRVPSASGDVFVTVWEPMGKKPIIERVEAVHDPSFGTDVDRTVGVKVVRADGVTDTVWMSYMDRDMHSLGSLVSSDAVTVLISEGPKGTEVAAAGGSKLVFNGTTKELPGTLRGTVDSVDYENRVVQVKDLDKTPNNINGLPIRFYTNKSAMYRVANADHTNDRLRVTLSEASMITGRFKVVSVDAAKRQVSVRATLVGTHAVPGNFLLNKDFQAPVAIESMSAISSGYVITVADGAPLAKYGEKEDAWMSDVGPGNTVQVERVLEEWDPWYEEPTPGPGEPTDGGYDAGGAAVHDGDNPDGGREEEDDGCSCGVAGRTKELPGAWLWLLGASAVGTARRTGWRWRGGARRRGTGDCAQDGGGAEGLGAR